MSLLTDPKPTRELISPRSTRAPGAPSLAERSCHLDLLRTTAILMVVSFHLIQMSPIRLPGLLRFAAAGKYGVDLFFVLSGWLIGSLFWREQVRFGQVSLVRFWSRRWLRTIPPYLVALAFSWLAVAVERKESFNWGYFLFIQNYYEIIPFFLVSWSLCIEEHFYVFLPLLLVFTGRSKVSITVLFATLILIPMVCRCSLGITETSRPFGYWDTATHLRMEGLLLGFGSAYLAHLQPRLWSIALRSARGLVLVCGAGLAGLLLLPEIWMYRVGLTVLAFGMCGTLVALTERKPGKIASSRPVKWIALASYSIYLSHPLTLHIARRISAAFPIWHGWLYFPVALLLIAAAGGLFYFAVERTSIQLRDLWVPRRTRSTETNVIGFSTQASRN
jgi:peptidoglycan/LPS O-acetylase OafA/YrhL